MKAVLLVEDDPHTGLALKRWISHLKFQVDLCTSVSEAKHLLTQKNEYAAVISDFHLPDGVGTEVEQVAKLNGIHCVIYSGDPSSAMGYTVIEKTDLHALTEWLLENVD
jgi:DNA-binding response OmpR family regulator